MTGLGLALGGITALAINPLLRSALYRVEAHDPYLMMTAVVTILLVSALACWIPARRAAHVDPIEVLRGD